MATAARVLVIEGLAETAEVLQAALAPQGLQVDRERAFASTSSHEDSPPSVLVLHADQLAEAVPSTTRHWSSSIPTVVIHSGVDNTARAAVRELFTESRTTAAASTHRHLEQPFQYSELVQTVQALLEANERPEDRSGCEPAEILAARAEHPRCAA